MNFFRVCKKNTGIGWQVLIVFGILVIGGMVLRTIGIDLLGLGDHEIPSVLFSRDSTIGESNGILYHNLYLPLWILTWGDSVLSMRLASLMCSLGGLVGMFFLGHKIGGVKLGAGAAFFLAINNFDILYSQHIRFHEFNSCMCVWATFAFVYFLERPRWSYWLLYALLGTLCLGSMVLSYLLLCLQILGALLFVPASRRAWLWLLGHFTLFTTEFALLWGIDANAYPRIDELQVPVVGELLSSFTECFAFVKRFDASLPLERFFAETPVIILCGLSAALLAWHLVCLLRGRSCAQHHSGWILASIAAIPCIWVASFVLKPIFKPSNLSFILPLFALLFAICLYELPRHLRYVVLLALLLLNSENLTSHSFVDRYSTEACVSYIASYLRGDSDYPHAPCADVPSYVFGFPWRICCQGLMDTRAHIFLDAMQIESPTEAISREEAFLDMVFDAEQGTFPSKCDLWYYTPFTIEDADIEVIYEQLHPRYITTFDFMGRCLLRIRMDGTKPQSPAPIPFRNRHTLSRQVR